MYAIKLQDQYYTGGANFTFILEDVLQFDSVIAAQKQLNILVAYNSIWASNCVIVDWSN